MYVLMAYRQLIVSDVECSGNYKHGTLIGTLINTVNNCICRPILLQKCGLESCEL